MKLGYYGPETLDLLSGSARRSIFLGDETHGEAMGRTAP